MTDEEKVRENLVRRMLYRQGYALSKSKTRDSRAWDYGVYLITHILAGYDSGVVAAYCRSLDEAEKWALEGDRAAELEDASGRPEEDWEEIATVGAGWLGGRSQLGEADAAPGLPRIPRVAGRAGRQAHGLLVRLGAGAWHALPRGRLTIYPARRPRLRLRAALTCQAGRLRRGLVPRPWRPGRQCRVG